MTTHESDIDAAILPHTQPDYDGSEYMTWTEEARIRLDNSALCCKVCGAVPHPNGWRDHGKGCYRINENGGGSDCFDVADLMRVLESQ